ncbi:MAG TPA: PilZ domain-containing protein [Candidatus Angelobacter sp.]|nr:PilZ domain-containing protein [Candidatus Angelobacter sp.]
MSPRGASRRKAVLEVTVIRHERQEKQLVHALDFTETTARLGGLALFLEPGEIVEIQCGASKGNFQVFWMGAPGSSMEGQAGVRCAGAGKFIWDRTVPQNENEADLSEARQGEARQAQAPLPSPTSTQLPGERRWNPRHACKGSVSLVSPGSTFVLRGEVRDISQGGIYAELTAPLPVDTEVVLSMIVENIPLEAKGFVRASYPLVGMAISFRELTAQNEHRLARILEKVGRHAVAPRADHHPNGNRTQSSAYGTKRANQLQLEACPVRTLATALQSLATNFDHWNRTGSVNDIDALRHAVQDLQQRLTTPRPPEPAKYLGPSASRKDVA